MFAKVLRWNFLDPEIIAWIYAWTVLGQCITCGKTKKLAACKSNFFFQKQKLFPINWAYKFSFKALLLFPVCSRTHFWKSFWFYHLNCHWLSPGFIMWKLISGGGCPFDFGLLELRDGGCSFEFRLGEPRNGGGMSFRPLKLTQGPLNFFFRQRRSIRTAVLALYLVGIIGKHAANLFSSLIENSSDFLRHDELILAFENGGKIKKLWFWAFSF